MPLILHPHVVPSVTIRNPGLGVTNISRANATTNWRTTFLICVKSDTEVPFQRLHITWRKKLYWFNIKLIIHSSINPLLITMPRLPGFKCPELTGLRSLSSELLLRFPCEPLILKLIDYLELLRWMLSSVSAFILSKHAHIFPIFNITKVIDAAQICIFLDQYVRPYTFKVAVLGQVIQSSPHQNGSNLLICQAHVNALKGVFSLQFIDYLLFALIVCCFSLLLHRLVVFKRYYMPLEHLTLR